MPPGDSLEPSRRPPDAALTQVTPDARERVVEVLTRHYAADRLTDAELQARLDRVYAATTPADLQAVTADLPAEPAGAPAPAVGTEIRAFLSGQEQRLAGPLPRRLRLRARLGYVELDLRHATFEPGVTEIEVSSLLGYVEIQLPAGVRVESTGHALVGYFAVRGLPASRGDLPLVRITGRAVLGYAECFLPSQPQPLPAGPR